MRGTELVPENVLPGILDAVAMIDGLFVSSPPGACAPTGNTHQCINILDCPFVAVPATPTTIFGTTMAPGGAI